jgi:replicative DNA helicase
VLWQGREARRVATDLLRLDTTTAGDQLVGQFSRRLASIESKKVADVKSLAEIMVDRLATFQSIAANPNAVEYWATGYRQLDVMVGGFRKGEMFTIAARPGVGKTSLVTTVADNLATRGVPVCIFQLEDNADAVADRAILRRAKIGSALLRDPGAWQKHHWDVVANAVGRDVSLPVYVDDRHQRTMGDLCAQMRKLARDKGVKVFILDNLSEVLLDKADRGDERLDRALGRMSKQFRDTAQSVGAAAVLVVHLNREIEKRGGDARLSDIKNSGEVEDASHVVAVLSRLPDSESLTVDIVKNRNGAKGKIDLKWNGPHMTVENW